MPETFADVGHCVDAVLRRVGPRIVLALPLGIGKPNPLVNEFYRRALRDPGIDLTVLTALSLLKPVARSPLEARLLGPLVERVFGSYVEPDYARAMQHDALPANVRIIEFYLVPGAFLASQHAQRHYLSANHTHVAPDCLPRGPNGIPHPPGPPGTPDSGRASSHTASPCPSPGRVRPRHRRRLGDELGLTLIGINLTMLPPGKESSMRHWHTHEDEFVYVLEGEVVLRTDEGEQVLTAGMCAGFVAGVANGHQLINRSERPALYLEVSNRESADDRAHYPDIDLLWNPPHAPGRFTRRDGTPY